ALDPGVAVPDAVHAAAPLRPEVGRDVDVVVVEERSLDQVPGPGAPVVVLEQGQEGARGEQHVAVDADHDLPPGLPEDEVAGRRGPLGLGGVDVAPAYGLDGVPGVLAADPALLRP